MSSSEPLIWTGSEPSLLTAGISEELTQARATSSITITVARASAPAPPYSSGTWGAWKSAARRAWRGLLGEACVLVDVGGVRRDLGIGDRTDRLTNRLVLLGEGVDGEV